MSCKEQFVSDFDSVFIAFLLVLGLGICAAHPRTAAGERHGVVEMYALSSADQSPGY